ncbi:MAG: hypothetical protein LUC30_07390, partial [Clostridiales bacterium]|nr:hypothetical protein [Clostridiales bacterium]
GHGQFMPSVLGQFSSAATPIGNSAAHTSLGIIKIRKSPFSVLLAEMDTGLSSPHFGFASAFTFHLVVEL